MYEHDVVPIDEIRPNAFNYNVQDKFIFDKEKKSIVDHGFMDPITVREAVGELDKGTVARIADRADTTGSQISSARYEIVDGEHRWLAVRQVVEDIEAGTLTVVDGAVLNENGTWVHGGSGTRLSDEEVAGEVAQELQKRTLAISNLGNIPDPLAKRLTITLNETKGSPDQESLSQLVLDIAQQTGYVDDLPFTDDQLKTLLEQMGEEDLQTLLDGEFKPDEEEEKERGPEHWGWVEAALPPDFDPLFWKVWEYVSNHLSENGTPLHESDSIANGQVLEILVAEYVASNGVDLNEGEES